LEGDAALACAVAKTISRKPKNEAFSRLFDEDQCKKTCNLPVVLSVNAGGKIMTIKYILAVALITPLLTVSSMAQQYAGGPKSSVAPTTRQISSGGDIYAQGLGGDIYAQGIGGDIYAPGVKANKSHAYRGGPKTVVPHRN
jgi:hypothetical protein